MFRQINKFCTGFHPACNMSDVCNNKEIHQWQWQVKVSTAFLVK